MKLTTNSRYGLRSLIDLVANYSGVPVSLNEIADRQWVSVGYLEQTFSLLRRIGLVTSAKGNKGGYLPAAGLSQTKVGDLLRILEGDLDLAEIGSAYEGPDIIKRCLREQVWDPLNGKVTKIVDGIRLIDLVEAWTLNNRLLLECERTRSHAQESEHERTNRIGSV